MTRIRTRLLVILLATLPILGACKSSDDDPAPTTTVRFKNESVSNRTYDVIWDGSRIVSLDAGRESQAYTTSPGQHTLLFRFSNDGTPACSESTPNLAAGARRIYTCRR